MLAHSQPDIDAVKQFMEVVAAKLDPWLSTLAGEVVEQTTGTFYAAVFSMVHCKDP